jgi:hypothetical protein
VGGSGATRAASAPRCTNDEFFTTVRGTVGCLKNADGTNDACRGTVGCLKNADGTNDACRETLGAAVNEYLDDFLVRNDFLVLDVCVMNEALRLGSLLFLATSAATTVARRLFSS